MNSEFNVEMFIESNRKKLHAVYHPVTAEQLMALGKVLKYNDGLETARDPLRIPANKAVAMLRRLGWGGSKISQVHAVCIKEFGRHDFSWADETSWLYSRYGNSGRLEWDSEMSRQESADDDLAAVDYEMSELGKAANAAYEVDPDGWLSFCRNGKAPTPEWMRYQELLHQKRPHV